MARSLKKGPWVDERLLKRIQELNRMRDKKVIRTWARRSMIVPDFVGHTFEVHNGKTFQKVLVSEEMVGHKLGEFAPTRTFRGHGGKEARRGL